MRRIRNEIQRKLRQRGRETVVRVEQPAGIANRETDASGTGARSCESDVRGGEINGRYPIRDAAFGQGKRKASGAAPKIEHPATIRWPRELRKRTREKPRPPPEKPLIGGPIARAVR